MDISLLYRVILIWIGIIYIVIWRICQKSHIQYSFIVLSYKLLIVGDGILNYNRYVFSTDLKFALWLVPTKMHKYTDFPDKSTSSYC